MFTKKFTLGMVICLISGCTSFRTTALSRLDNDSVIPECRKCNKLNGLPVKLKVPSHVRVVIYEQQLLLANNDEEKITKKEAATTTAGVVKDLKRQITALHTEVDDAAQEFSDGTKELDARTKQSNSADLMPQTTSEEIAAKKVAQGLAKLAIELAQKRVAAAQVRQTKAMEKRDAELADLEAKLVDASRLAAIAADAAVVGYTLVSFTPAQLVVETELEYTDKIFMVDFRRPAGGILNLSEASMDDEQYFAKIQADVTERTMADVSTAIETLQGPLTKKSKDNVATPTSADTPESEQSNTVNFQKSVVAFKRFDISEPGWEQCMMDFVNLRLGTSYVSNYVEDFADATPQTSQNSAYVHSETIPPAYVMPIDDVAPQTGDFSRIEQLESDRNVPAIPFVAGPNTNRYQ